MAAAGAELYAELKRQGLGDRDLAVVRQAISNLSDNARDNPSDKPTANTAAKTNEDQ